MKHGQTAANIIPLRRGKPMDVPSLDDFPEEVQDVVYEILARALQRRLEKEAS